jgi:hypothetical protein
LVVEKQCASSQFTRYQSSAHLIDIKRENKNVGIDTILIKNKITLFKILTFGMMFLDGVIRKILKKIQISLFYG